MEADKGREKVKVRKRWMKWRRTEDKTQGFFSLRDADDEIEGCELCHLFVISISDRREADTEGWELAIPTFPKKFIFVPTN